MVFSNKASDASTLAMLLIISCITFQFLKFFKIKKATLKFIPFLFATTILTYAHTHTYAFASGLSYICLIVSQNLLEQNMNLISFARHQFQNIFVFPKLLVGPIDIINESHIEKLEIDFKRILLGIIKLLIFLPIWRDIDHNYEISLFAWNTEQLFKFAFIGVWHYVDLYVEFSGAIDIIIPTLKIYGIKSLENFNQPYLATSIEDFWRRWHISLGQWLMKNVYIPLGGNKNGLLLHSISIIIVMLSSALWHGVGINYLIWGLIQGICIIFNKHFKFTSMPLPFKWCLTQLVVVISWVVFFEFK